MLFALVAAPVVIAFLVTAQPSTVAHPSLAAARPIVPATLSPPVGTDSSQRLQALVPYLAWLWLAGPLFSVVSIGAGLAGARRLRVTSFVLDHPVVHEAVRNITTRWPGMAPPRIRGTIRSGSPLAVGIFRPVVLLPVSLLTGLTTEQVEMILLHEMAHLRRHDNAVQLLQQFAETLFFFQPAVWIVSAWLRREREHCCDRFVLDHTGDPHRYVETLLAVATAPRIPAAAAAFNDGKLIARVSRILDLKEIPMRRRSRVLLPVLVVLASSLLVVASPGNPESTDDTRHNVAVRTATIEGSCPAPGVRSLGVDTSNCAACHTGVPPRGANPHATPDGNCTNCHTTLPEEFQPHGKLDECASCHDASAWHPTPKARQTCPLGESPHHPQPSPESCGTCHTKAPPTHPRHDTFWHHLFGEPTACANCHTVHVDDRTFWHGALPDGSQCQDCHVAPTPAAPRRSPRVF